MLRQKTRLVISAIYIFDIVLTIVSFFIAYRVRDTYFAGSYGSLVSVKYYLWLLLLIIPVWSFLFYYFRVYESFRTKPFWMDPWKIFKVVFWGVLFLGTSVFIFKLQHVSRLFIGLFALVNLVLLCLEKTIIRSIASSVRKKGYNYRNILIVGTGGRAREIARIIEEHRHWGMRMIGFVSDNSSLRAKTIGGYDVVGKVEDIPDLIKGQVIDEMVFAVSRKRLEELEELFLLCEEQGINARVAINFFPQMTAKVHLEDLHGVPLLTFTTTPYNKLTLVAKRGIDLFISALMLFVLTPFLLVMSVLIKLTSEGPIFFRQQRVGLNGRRFTLYKFRSMVQNAEEIKKDMEHLNELDGPVFKIKKDPRVTRFGRFIRKTSIDELPQFFNVLKGEMSMVGPRPPVPDEVNRYDRWQRRRLSMKPGITCLWQISGRNKIGFKKWMELDLQYIDNWSLGLDFKIFMKTIPVVLFGKGAS
ncbi:MAG: sugar transferase [Thermodesulfobacteriota bacterium]